MWRRRSWFSLKGKADILGQTEGCPATSIGPRVPPVGSLQQRDGRSNAEKSPASVLKRGRQAPGGEDSTGYSTNVRCSLFVPVWLSVPRTGRRSAGRWSCGRAAGAGVGRTGGGPRPGA